ncbi:MAG: DnaJ domain-containing protein [Pirellulales bacterium]
MTIALTLAEIVTDGTTLVTVAGFGLLSAFLASLLWVTMRDEAPSPERLAFPTGLDAPHPHHDVVTDSPNSGLVAMLVKFAKLDGDLTPAEIEIIEDVAAGQFVDESELLAIYRDAKNANTSVAGMLDKYLSRYGVNGHFIDQFLTSLFAIAYVDHDLSKAERKGLEGVCDYLGRDFDEELDAYLASVDHQDAELREAYRVLDVPMNADDDRVEAAYRRLIMQHHPDHAAAGGASDEEYHAAAERFKTIHAAHQHVLLSRSVEHAA